MLTLWPILINIVLFAIVFFLFFWVVDSQVAGRLDTDSGSAFMQAVRVVVFMVAVLFAFLFSMVVCYLAASVIGSPFYNKISEMTENECLHDHPHLKVRGGVKSGWLVGRMMRKAAARLGRVLPIYLLLLIVSLIPIIGAPLALVLAFMRTTTFMALDSFSYSLDRRGLGNRQQLQWIKSHPRSTLGIGSGMMMLLLIPCAFVLIPPLGSVAATREHCRLLIIEGNRKELTQGS